MPFTKIVKYILIVLGVLVICVFVSDLGVGYYFNKKIRSRLETEVHNASGGEYKLSIGEIHVSIFTKSFVVNGIKLIPKTPEEKYSDPRFRVTANKIIVHNFSLWKFLRSQDLRLSSVTFVQPEIKIYQQTRFEDVTANDSLQYSFPLYQIVKSEVRSVSIEHVEIKNCKLDVFKSFSDTIGVFTGRGNNIAIANFRVNDTCEKMHHIFLADDLMATTSEFVYNIAELYHLEGKNFKASYKDSSVTIDSLKLIPKYSKKEFAYKAGRQTDRIQSNSSAIRFKNLDVKLFYERNWLITDEMEIKSLSISAYRDKNVRRDPHEAKSLQQLIRDTPFLIKIRKTILRHANIIYEELGKEKDKTVTVKFSDLNGIIENLNNDTLHYDEKSSLHISATGNFMDRAKSVITLDFPLNTTKSVFTSRGKMGAMPVSTLTDFFQTQLSLTFKSGEVDSMIFSINANDQFSAGTMRFYYHDLSVQLINDENKSGLKEKIMTTVINNFIIKKSNPEKNREARITEIHYERDRQKFIFNYLWNSLLSGIKPAIGIKEKNKKEDT